MTVVYAFDTLGYAKRLRDGGVPNPQAEAHAEAARDFIMTKLVTKQDLQTAVDTLTLRLTVRLGRIVAAGAGVWAPRWVCWRCFSGCTDPTFDACSRRWAMAPGISPGGRGWSLTSVLEISSVVIAPGLKCW
jgi:hypothetical protein